MDSSLLNSKPLKLTVDVGGRWVKTKETLIYWGHAMVWYSYATLKIISICGTHQPPNVLVSPSHLLYTRLTIFEHVFGLGYDAIMDDYKVIRVVMYHTLKFQNEVHMFSRNSGTWRRIGDFPFEYPLGMPGVYVKGRLHWQVSMGTDIYSIAYFDCSSETYGTMRIQSDCTGYLRFYDLGSLDDETLIIYSTFCNSFDNLKLWILTDYGNDDSWFCVNFAPDGPGVANQGFISAIQPLYLLKPDNRLMFFRIDPLGTYIRYDLITGIFEIVHASNIEVVEFCSVFRVVESLVSPSINE